MTAPLNTVPQTLVSPDGRIAITWFDDGVEYGFTTTHYLRPGAVEAIDDILTEMHKWYTERNTDGPIDPEGIG